MKITRFNRSVQILVLGIGLSLAAIALFETHGDVTSDAVAIEKAADTSVVPTKDSARLPGSTQSSLDSSAELNAKLSGEDALRSPSSSQGQDWRSLLIRARSRDRVALEEVHRLANPCVGLPRGISERTALIAATSERGGDSVAERAHSVDLLTGKFEACDRIPESVHAAYARELFALRAEEGTFDAKFQYMVQGFPKDPHSATHGQELREFKERARRYLSEAMQGGDPEALSAMAWAYRRSNVFNPDPSRAYMYTYAFALASHEVDPEVLRRLAMMERDLIPGTIPVLRTEAERIAICCRKRALVASETLN